MTLNDQPLNDQQLLRYARHILLEGMGIEAQQKLQAAQVLIVGAGGLGSPAAYYLASSGVGTLTLVDGDTVELTNLQRQILHTTERLGQSKAQSGQQTLRQINPDINIVALNEYASENRLFELIKTATVVLDCSDNFATRHAINRACCFHRVPLVSGAAIGFAGQLAVFDLRQPASPCYACLFPEENLTDETRCATSGVFAPLVGMIGSMQAAQTLKIIAGFTDIQAGELQLLEAQTLHWSSFKIEHNPGCKVCQHAKI